MRIALIAFRFGPSHGSILQSYALYTVLKRMGHSVTIFDRQPGLDLKSTFIGCVSRIKHRLIGDYYGPVFYSGDYSRKSMAHIKGFINKYLAKDVESFRSAKALQRLLKNRYDAYIVGSDQTWRPKYVYDIYYYFLGFLPIHSKAKRIAYAPSFGVDDWEYDEIQTMRCKELAQLFDAISVREQSGVALCKKYLDKDAVHVLDPTLLLKREDYETLLPYRSFDEEHYIAYSVLDDSEKTQEVLEFIRLELKLPLRRINKSSFNERGNNVEPAIEDWLMGIRDADFIVTDSFHATVFSIIFNRPFLTIGNRGRGLSRFSSILNLVGLHDRLFLGDYSNSQPLLSDNIDWDIVNQRLDIHRQLSIKFIENSMSQKAV